MVTSNSTCWYYRRTDRATLRTQISTPRIFLIVSQCGHSRSSNRLNSISLWSTRRVALKGKLLQISAGSLVPRPSCGSEVSSVTIFFHGHTFAVTFVHKGVNSAWKKSNMNREKFSLRSEAYGIPKWEGGLGGDRGMQCGRVDPAPSNRGAKIRGGRKRGSDTRGFPTPRAISEGLLAKRCTHRADAS